MGDLADLMRMDPLGEAEKVTGKSYKEDDGTSALGFLMHLEHTARVKAAALAEGDTYYSIDLAGALAVFLDLGFEEVLLDEFEHEGRRETYRVLWHPDGILGTLESYSVDGMNSAKIYYNVESTDSLDRTVTSSGGYAVHEEGRKVWSGNHDARTGLRASIAGLRQHGRFLPKWVDRPHLWPITYAESRALDGLDWKTKGKVHDDFRQARLERLPEYVRSAITPD